MNKPTDCRIKQTSSRTRRFGYRSPMKFGGRVVTEATLLEVEIEIETCAGRRGTGRGSMPLGNVWAWPSQQCSNEQTLAAMCELGSRFAARIGEPAAAAHPLQLAMGWHELRTQLAESIRQEMQLPEPIPQLAQYVATSPSEAALFDAQGQALQQNAYNLLSADFVSQDLSAWLGADFRGEHLDRYTSRVPQSRMPLYHLVGALDPLDASDLIEPIGDGLPETLAEWIPANGLTHLKIKLNGDDLAWDVARVVDIERITATAQQRGLGTVAHYSLDFNEKCRDVAYVLEFLDRVQAASPAAYARVQYIEQPTHRDLRANMQNRMHAAAQRKPVVIDESLVDFESLLLSRELGYSGVAIKACKGHAEALLMGAAAQKYQLFLCVQDLTCPGASFLHSASLAARIPTVAAIEGNGRQYCPSGNLGWEVAYPSMFVITAGSVGTSVLDAPGLGFSWPASEHFLPN